MARAGLEVAGPIRELYLNDPCKTAEEELLTEIQIPYIGHRLSPPLSSKAFAVYMWV
jgi:hypothetical protein